MAFLVFLILLVVIIIGGYAQWRLKQVNDPAAFLKERFFSPLAGVLTLFFIAFTIVNGFLPDTVNMISNPYNGKKIQPEKVDYTRVDSHKQLLKAHLNRIDHGNMGERNLSKEPVFRYYQSLAHSFDPEKSDFGHYYLALAYLWAEEFEKAEEKLDNVMNPALPAYNHYKGKIKYHLNQQEEAETYLNKSITKHHEKSSNSSRLLYQLYKEDKSDSTLANFIAECGYLAALPLDEARYKAFTFGYLGTYTKILALRVLETFSFKTLLVAFLIAFIWGFFLFKLTLKRWEKPLHYLTIFLLGALFSLGVFYMSDGLKYFTGFELNGKVWNDLLYSIIGIGLVEEIVKIIPLLIFLRFTRIIQEPYDYLLVAGLSALGFAFLENVQYFNESLGGIIAGRTLTATLLHMILTSIVAYGLILGLYQKTRLPVWLVFTLHLCLAAILHGFYDFFIFHGGVLMGLLNLGLFIFYVRVWTVMLNNGINFSSAFNYQNNVFYDNLRFYVIVILSGIFFLDYFFIGWQKGASMANEQLWYNLAGGGLLIFILAIKLSRFDLVPNYWQRITVFTENLPRLKKREDFSGGYEEHYLNKADPKKSMFGGFDPGLLGGVPNLISANLVYPKNFIHQRITIDRYANNRRLDGILSKRYLGLFLKRIIVSHSDSPDPSSEGDPDWFLLEMEAPVSISGKPCSQFLLKFKSKNPALSYDEDLMGLLCLTEDKNPKSEPIFWEDLTNYGWVLVNKA